MNMDKIADIVSKFLKIKADELTEATVIDRRAIPGSILLHRMYSLLSHEGLHVKNRADIKTFGDLLKCNGKESSPAISHDLLIDKSDSYIKSSSAAANMVMMPQNIVSVGIDMEEIEHFPVTTDYRGDKFYTDNFTSQEISYCILQIEPKQSFAGKFAAKEAIVKADNSFKEVPFNQIEILSNGNGKPQYGSFSISISHTATHAVAIAIKIDISKVVHSASHFSTTPKIDK